MSPQGQLLVIAAVSLGLAAGCRSAAGDAPIVQPGAPGQPSRTVAASVSTDGRGGRFTPADVAFMQGMIGHHQQAIEMVTLLETRTAREDMKLLGQRIRISQADEIEMMKDWLRIRGQALPDPHAHHMHGATLMPGMLTADEMTTLAAASGPAFDRLFLEGMIKHHGGALTMVDALFASPGAGQESEVYAFASDVEADQQMEITRMQRMLAGS